MSTSSPDTKQILDQIIGELGNDNESLSRSSPKESIPESAHLEPWKLPNTITTEQIIKTLLIVAGVGFSAYNVYQSFQIEKERDRQNLRCISILILVIFVILLVMIPFQ